MDKGTDRMKVLFLSTYPPRECGIATFTQDIVRELEKTPDITPKVVAISHGGESYGEEVLFDLMQDSEKAYRIAADKINASGAALLMVEHEYGIYGGQDGAWLLQLMRHVDLPVLITCHTVLPHPTKGQQQVLAQACQMAAGVVAMGRLSKRMLEEIYAVEPGKIHLLHHGVPDYTIPNRDALKAEEGLAGRFVVSTFGLLSPGKGLEYGIQAIARVAEKHPEVCYLVLGQTHPVVKRRDGEAYRHSLTALARQLGIEDKIRFVDRYLYKPDILHYLALSDVYMTPYLSRDQAVSGTLAYAIGCGRVVVSTPYIYAKEMLADGRGLLAEFESADALAENIEKLAGDPALKSRMEAATLRLGKTMVWPRVVAGYAQLFRRYAGGERRVKVS